MKIVCCLCGKVKSQHGWLRQQATVQNSRATAHAFCPECHEKTLKKINQPGVRLYNRYAKFC